MPPMPTSSAGGSRRREPTTFDKCNSAETFLIAGSYNIMKYGGGPSGPARTLGQYMLGSGATFGYDANNEYDGFTPHFEDRIADTASVISFFMSIGTIIRTEGDSQLAAEMYARARRRPVTMPRRLVRRPCENE
ncbi:subunit of TIM23 translocase complex [Lecanora helva]